MPHPPRPGNAAPRPRPVWRVVFGRELMDLWVGRKGLVLLFFYSLLLGLWSYILATNTELQLIPPAEMVRQMLEATIAAGCFIALIAGADTISGDRERHTLEGLLLTPTSRRQLMVGKFLAAASLWPAVFLITIPYLTALSRGEGMLGPALLWGALLGTLLVPAMASLGMLVSMWSSTIRTSMIVGLGIYLLVMMPTALSGSLQSGPLGQLFQQVSPMTAGFHFLASVLVAHLPVAEVWRSLLAPLFCALLLHALLFAVAAPRLRLEASLAALFPASWRRRGAGALAIASLLVFPAGSSAAQAPERGVEATAPGGARHAGIRISADVQHQVLQAGDSILYRTSVINHGTETSRPLAVAMNIINLDPEGEVVDPEDWSPERTQYVGPLQPGESVELQWRVNAILGGDYMVYMVAVPRPDDSAATSRPATGPGIHLTVQPFTPINPRGILPYVVGTPLLLLVALGMVTSYRRRSTEREVALASSTPAR